MSKETSTTASTTYLKLYNTLSLILWSILTIRITYTFTKHGNVGIFEHNHVQTRNTQLLALLEIAHALIGIVKAPLLPVTFQVGGRLAVVALLESQYGHRIMADSRLGQVHQAAFYAMVIAWSYADIIRFSYFLSSKDTHGWLTWFRYSAFVLLYPVGLTTEAWIVYFGAVKQAQSPVWVVTAWIWLGLYVPGEYLSCRDRWLRRLT